MELKRGEDGGTGHRAFPTEREADGGYVAIASALPGCVSQGDTREDVIRNIREAADPYIEDCIAGGDRVPTEAGREYFELVTTGPQ